MYFPSVFRHRLPIMASLAQGLPVPFIPEQLGIPTVWNTMVNNFRLHVSPFSHASDTQRMCLQVPFSGFLPLSVITAAGSGPDLFRVQWFVRITVLGSRGNQCSAAGMLAWYVRSARHGYLLS